MELSHADGGSLQEQLNQAKMLETLIPSPTVLTWMTSTLTGLAYIHSKQVLHGDLKPANLLLQRGEARSAFARALPGIFATGRCVRKRSDGNVTNSHFDIVAD